MFKIWVMEVGSVFEEKVYWKAYLSCNKDFISARSWSTELGQCYIVRQRALGVDTLFILEGN